MKINKLTSWLLAVATLAGVTSCGSGSSDDYWKNIDALAVQESSEGNWSFYKPDGTLLYEDEFKSEPTVIYRGFFAVKEGDGYTVYRADKKPEVVGDLEDLKAVGFFYEEDLMPVVRAKERISVVNTKGETVFTLEPYKGKEIVSCNAFFSDGLLFVKTENDLYGFVDTKGEMVIEPKYKQVSSFNYGRCVVAKDDEDGTSLIIDKKGQPLFTLRKGQEIENASLSDKYILVRDGNDHLLILDTKGETVFKCPSKVKRLVAIQGEMLIFKNDDGEFGLMNLEGETLIRPKYNSLQFMDGDKLLAQLDDYAVVINYEGEESLRLEDYESVSWVGKYGYLAHERKDYVFLDKEGKNVKNAEFENINMTPIISGFWGITSDYFNMDAVVNAVVGLVKDNGVGKYHFGEYPSQVFSDDTPREYVGDFTGKIKDLQINGIKYSITVTGYFSSAIARYNYSYYSSSRYEWGDGTLYGFFIEINTQAEWGYQGSDALISAFERNGCKLIARTKKDADMVQALLIKNNELIIVGSSKEDSSGNVHILQGSEDDDYVAYLKSYIEGINNDEVIDSDMGEDV